MQRSTMSKLAVLSLLPVSLLFSPVVSATAAEATPAAAQQSLVLTLDKAIEQTLANSAELKRKRLTAEYADLEYQLKKNDGKAVAEDTVTTLKTARTKYEDTAKYYKEMQLAYYNQKDLERKLRLDASTSYYDAVHARAIGDQPAFDEAMKKLNKLMGAKADQAYRVTDREEPTVFTLPTLEEAVELAAQNRPDVMKCKAEQEYNKRRIEIVSRWSFIGSLEGRMVMNKATVADLDYNDCYKTAVADVTKNYEALKAAIAKKDSAGEELGKADKSAGDAYNEAVHAYNLALAAYQYALGL